MNKRIIDDFVHAFSLLKLILILLQLLVVYRSNTFLRKKCFKMMIENIEGT